MSIQQRVCSVELKGTLVKIETKKTSVEDMVHTQLPPFRIRVIPPIPLTQPAGFLRKDNFKKEVKELFQME